MLGKLLVCVFRSRFADIPQIALDTAEIARARSAAQARVLSVLRGKQDRPLERMQLGQDAMAAIEAFERRRLEAEDLSHSFQRENDAIAVVREQAAAGNVVALTRDVAGPDRIRQSLSPRPESGVSLRGPPTHTSTALPPCSNARP